MFLISVILAVLNIKSSLSTTSLWLKIYALLHILYAIITYILYKH
nr:MAG TPA: hypothetical protein [Caudoviricetes sp.]